MLEYINYIVYYDSYVFFYFCVLMYKNRNQLLVFYKKFIYFFLQKYEQNIFIKIFNSICSVDFYFSSLPIIIYFRNCCTSCIFIFIWKLLRYSYIQTFFNLEKVLDILEVTELYFNDQVFHCFITLYYLNVYTYYIFIFFLLIKNVRFFYNILFFSKNSV